MALPRIVAPLGVLALILAACGGGDDIGQPSGSTPSAGSGEVAIVGSAGGTAVSGDGRLSLVVPAGALDSEASLSISQVPAEQWPEEMAGLDEEAIVYRLEPGGLSFDQAVSFTMTMDLDVGDDGSVAPPLAVSVGDDGAWEPLSLDVVLDLEAGVSTIRGEISHFSWIVGHSGDLALGLEEITPRERSVGEEWEAAVQVRNVSTGTHRLGLSYKIVVQFVRFEALGEVEVVGTESHSGFTLDQGEARTLDFPKPRWQCTDLGEGAYRVVARAEIGGGAFSAFVDEARAVGAGLQELIGQELPIAEHVFTVLASVPVVCVTQYQATGGGSGMTVTGLVSDITKSFTVTGTFEGGSATLSFTPGATVIEPSTGDIYSSGTLSYSGGGSGVTVSGDGTYEISGNIGGPLTLNFDADGCATPGECRATSGVITLTPLSR